MVKSPVAYRVNVWQHGHSFVKDDTSISGTVSWDNNFRPLFIRLYEIRRDLDRELFCLYEINNEKFLFRKLVCILITCPFALSNIKESKWISQSRAYVYILFLHAKFALISGIILRKSGGVICDKCVYITVMHIRNDNVLQNRRT